MSPTIRRLRNPIRPAGAFLLAGLLLAATPAFAQDPVVTAADPDMAEQETYDLVVKVSGNNFGVDSEVDFFVSGTTDPGGIHVKNVKRKNPKTLEVTLDVAADAVVAPFDIQVRSNGRTGKGTELFRVLEKPTGNDTAPPGEVDDLTVTDVEYSSALVTWTAPADNGFDVQSGPAAGARIRMRLDGPFTPEIWETEDDAPLHLTWYLTSQTSPESGQPGDLIELRAVALPPESTIWVAVRYYDERDQWSTLSLEHQVAFTTPAPPIGSFDSEVVDSCPAGSTGSIWNLDLEFDVLGSPALLFWPRCDSATSGPLHLATRASDGSWMLEPLPPELASGWMSDDLAFDPVTNEASVATTDRLAARPKGALYFARRIAPGEWIKQPIESRGVGRLALAYCNGEPAIAYRIVQGPAEIRLAIHEPGGWTKLAIPYPSSSNYQLALACDPGTGRFAVAHREAPDGPGNREAAMVSTWNGTDWLHEEVHRAGTDSYGALNPSIAWDATRAGFTLTFSHARGDLDAGWVELCRRAPDASPPVWNCETLEIPPETLPGDTHLLIGSDGSEHLTYAVDYASLMYTWRPSGATVWQTPELAGWDTDNVTGFALDPLTDSVALSHFSAKRTTRALRYVRRDTVP